MKMKLSSFCVLSAAAQVLALPSLRERDDIEKYAWPKYCESQELRDAALVNGNRLAKDGKPDNPIERVMNLALAFYDQRENKELGIVEWIAQYEGAKFDWSCNGQACSYKDSACKDSEWNGRISLVLESVKNLYSYIDSLHKAIENQRDAVLSRIPSMFETFGGKNPDSVEWDKRIDTVTGGAAAMAALVPGAGAAGGAAAIGLAGAVSKMLLPEEEKEENFKWFAKTASGFGTNVQHILTSIEEYRKIQFEVPINHGIEFIQDQEDDTFFDTIMDGTFAYSPSPKFIESSDPNVLAGLAAPIINQIWRDGKIMVIGFDGQKFKEYGRDLCQENPYPDNQKNGGIKCDEDGTLFMIMQYSKGDPKDDLWSVAGDVKGLDTLESFGISGHDVIEGSLANQAAGGYNYVPQADELAARITTTTGPDSLQKGTVNIWNLPVCIGYPPVVEDFKDASAEDLMSIVILSCGQQQDPDGKCWPYGDPWYVEGDPENKCGPGDA